MNRKHAPWATLALALALAHAGCGAGAGDPTPATDASTDGSRAPDLTLPQSGTVYIVPGPPPFTYPIEAASVEPSGGQLKVRYNMPVLLVGGSQQVSLKGPIDSGTSTAAVSGAAGTATCDLAPGGGLSLRCSERLTGVTVDIAGVTRAANAQTAVPAADLIAVAVRFAGEPIGVLEVR